MIDQVFTNELRVKQVGSLNLLLTLYFGMLNYFSQENKQTFEFFKEPNQQLKQQQRHLVTIQPQLMLEWYNLFLDYS